MAIIRYFVEGKKDVRFLSDYIFHLSGKKVKESDFYKINGCSRELVELKKNDFKINTDSDGINLLIFDADENFSTKLREILQWRIEFDIQFELFLFPNHQNSGNLETLLENISLPEHRRIFDCFSAYESCIGDANPSYTLPNQKAKIYAYLEAILSKNKSEEIRDEKRNYLNPSLWDLNSDYLDILKTFLNQYL